MLGDNGPGSGPHKANRPGRITGDIMKEYYGNYQITYTISADKVREMCIKHEWYTRGVNVEYQELLSYVDRHRHFITMSSILSIAMNIIEHSNMYNEYSKAENIDNVVFFIIRECVDIFPSVSDVKGV